MLRTPAAPPRRRRRWRRCSCGGGAGRRSWPWRWCRRSRSAGSWRSWATVTGGGEVRETTPWVPALDLSVTLRLDALSLTLAALVTGVGALVLLYCARYFEPGDEGIGRFAGNLTAFAGSMLGLVLADDLLLLYVFWELTTVFSFLLIGGSGTRVAARRAASQALVLTTAGGLAMLVGLIMIGEASGSYLLSEVVADPGSGPVLVGGTVLVLVGAITKSAMVPFHFWLPAAMEAPTPVSAYLHAAAMVKAGIYLVARLAPGFADLPGWRPIVLGLGPGHDARRRLPRAAAERPQAAARLRHRQPARLPRWCWSARAAGSSPPRGWRCSSRTRCSSPRSSSPSASSTTPPASATCAGCPGWAGGCPSSRSSAALAAASMAGVPPLLGFVGKEAAFTALWDGGLPDRAAARPGPGRPRAGLGADRRRTRSGSCGARSPASPGLADTEPAELVHRARPAVPRRTRRRSPSPASLAGPASPLLEPLVARLRRRAAAASRRRPRSSALWHGLQPALALSALTLLGGAALFAVRTPVHRFQQRQAVGASADEGYWNTMQALDRLAVLVTGTTQRGSLPAYLGTILVVVLALPGSVLLFRAPWPGEWRAWDTPVQALRRRGRAGRRRARAAHPAAAVGGARRRRHRLRPRRPLRPAGRARPGAHPVPRRDAHPRRLRAGPAQAAEGHHRAAPARASGPCAGSSPSPSGC